LREKEEQEKEGQQMLKAISAMEQEEKIKSLQRKAQ